MKILLISTHPHPQRFTGRITECFVELAKQSDEHQVFVMDLYNSQWQQPYYDFALEKDEDFLATRQRIQAKIDWADQLVFVHPLWWGGQPAVLKNWIDCNITSGFAFKYNRRPQWQRRLWPLPIGLLAGKTAKLFITGDGQFWVYALLLMPFMNIYLLFIFLYCGIRPVSMRYFGGMRWRSDTNKQRILDSIRL